MYTVAKAGSEKNRFDQADRDHIRRALLRYMQEHAIGVPTLQKEIAAANDLSLDRVPLKTLQRFLGNTHRSNEALVRFCNHFVEAAPDTDPIAALGEQVAAFLGVWRDGHDCQPVPPDMAGFFATHTKIGVKPGQSMWVMPKDGSDRVPFSEFEIELLPGRAFAGARESVRNWNRSAPEPSDADEETTPRRSYEGIVISPNGSLFALMRNVLTGTPRIYWLSRYTEDRLQGYGHESFGSLDPTPVPGSMPHSTVQIILDPVKDGSK